MRQVRGYEKLDAGERCHLAIAAAARDDEAEFDKLLRTCPRKRYTATDLTFVDLKDTAMSATLAFSIDIAESIGRVQVFAVLAAQDEEWLEIVCQQSIRRAIDQMALFDHFAREHIGLTAETLLSAFCRPVLDKYRALTQGIDDYQGKVDPVLADEIKTAWREASLPSTPGLIANPAGGEA